MAHGSYHPPWRETEKDRRLKEQFQKHEIKELSKTMRLCAKCGEFNKFNYVGREVAFLHFTCPKCNEIIKVARLMNYNDQRKWE